MRRGHFPRRGAGCASRRPPRRSPHQARTSSVPAPASFLVKLRDLLSKEDVQIISWDAEGQITIGDPTALTDLILKNYFRHSNFSSFQRQLNYFGYYKVSGKGRFERCVYKNKAFVVDDETGVGLPLTLDALLRLRRKSSCHGDDGDDAPRAASRRRSGLAKRASRRVVELQEARRRTRARASSITTVEASSSGDEEDVRHAPERRCASPQRRRRRRSRA
ncbi:HSF-type DNA-binding-domain-containing protein [Pelagophyceae sp. CCMP2097]|nr:HSF-type DNA-binding-domain-containing protein [Pelagophyceae sp. CCMP2097]